MARQASRAADTQERLGYGAGCGERARAQQHDADAVRMPGPWVRRIARPKLRGRLGRGSPGILWNLVLESVQIASLRHFFNRISIDRPDLSKPLAPSKTTFQTVPPRAAGGTSRPRTTAQAAPGARPSCRRRRTRRRSERQNGGPLHVRWGAARGCIVVETDCQAVCFWNTDYTFLFHNSSLVFFFRTCPFSLCWRCN